MIVRSSNDELLLITQPAHAALAETLMRAWRADGLDTSRNRDAILLATRAHDDGWIEEDREPIVDDESGCILDFVSAPAAARQRVWPRSVGRLASKPYAAALVAQHALTIYGTNRGDAAWTAFFAALERMRDAHLASCLPLTLDDLFRDYFFVRAGDLMSLIFCNAWDTPFSLGRYALRLDEGRLTIDPDPFDGREVDFVIDARRLHKTRFDRRAAAAAFEAAPVVTLSGLASGS